MEHSTRIGTAVVRCATASKQPAGAWSSTAVTMSPTTSAYRATCRLVKLPASSRRSWVCRGGSMSIMDLRASIASCSRSSSELAPVSDE